ncbi:MAG TPA: acyl-CoA dehydrogenase family protein [Candidatus Binataceae bacterium]|nr:acyl-CoA dehydrogenase family protein [Candidatus Binataceae bacterium]
MINSAGADSTQESQELTNSERLARLSARARELIPVLRERAPRAEQIRQVPEETIRDFIEAGFFKILLPRRYGGFELDFGTAQIQIAGELGRGCGSSAWVCTVLAVQGFLSAMFSRQAQDEVFESPDNLVCCSYRGERSQIEPVPGGYRISGHWKFASGVDASQWALLGGAIRRATGPEIVWFLAPARDYEVRDEWFTTGLRATGSKDIIMNGRFVPEHRVTPLRLLAEGKGPGAAVNPCHIYRLPVLGTIAMNLSTAALGIAQGAVDVYCAQARAQKPGLGGVRRADIEANQLQIAEAAASVDCGRALLRADAAQMNDTLRTGAALSAEQRSRFRRDVAFVGAQFVHAVDILQNINGAHGIFDGNPIQRAFNDLVAMRTHAGLQWRPGGLNWGRVALGLEPTLEL